MKFPVSAGIPEISPDEFIFKPFGKPSAVRVIGEVPDVFIVAEYALPTAPSDNFETEIVGFTGFALIVKVTVLLTSPHKVEAALKVTLLLPALAGFPVIAPVFVLNLRLLGNVPLSMVQVSGVPIESFIYSLTVKPT